MTILILFIAGSLISEFFEILAKQFITQCTFFPQQLGKNNHLQLFLTRMDLVPGCTDSEPGSQEGSLAYTDCHCLQVSVSSDQTHQENAVFGASFQLEVVFFQDTLANQP